MSNRKGGIIQFSIDGTVYEVQGNFTYGLGTPKREAMIGSDGSVQGYSEQGQVPFIEGTVTDSADLDLEALANLTDVTAQMELANGKIFALRNAWYAGDAQGTTEKGEFPIRFEGKSGKVI